MKTQFRSEKPFFVLPYTSFSFQTRFTHGRADNDDNDDDDNDDHDDQGVKDAQDDD